MKKTLRIFITLCMAMFLLGSITVGVAAKSYPIWIGNTQFTDANRTAGIPCGNGTATLQLPKNSNGPYTLTLENATIPCEKAFNYNGISFTSGIVIDADCELVLLGENKIKTSDDLSFAEILGTENLTVSGSGSLNTYAVRTYGDLQWKGTGIISLGWIICSGNVTMEHQNKFTVGRINADSFTMNSGYVTVHSSLLDSPGIKTKGMITINGGNLNAIGYHYKNMNIFESNTGIELNVPATALFALKGDTLDPSTLTVQWEKDGRDFTGKTKLYMLFGRIGPDYGDCYVQHVIFGDPYGYFIDHNQWGWAKPYIDFNLDNELMKGTGEDTFGPLESVTRAQMVTTLYRLAESPDSSSDIPFTDVETNQWYTKAIAWAYNNKVTTGYSETYFGTNDNVTREDVVTFFWRYENKPNSATSLEKFSDAKEVSDYAKEAMAWAVEKGIINGTTPTTLDPQGTATRAQLAKIINVYAKEFHKDIRWIDREIN